MLAIYRYAIFAFLKEKLRGVIIHSLLGLSLIMSQHIGAQDETLSVGFIKADRLPYFANKSGDLPVRGLYVDLLDKISQHSGIKFDYQFIPQARIRLYMKNGLLDIEPGIDRSWRLEPKEAENSVYSIPFMQSKEVIAYNKDKFPNFSLSTPNLSTCAVLGFSQSNVAKDSRILTEVQILNMLQKGRCDSAEFPVDVLKYHLNKGHPSIRYTQPHSIFSLRLRLHISKKYLLANINNSIRSLLDSGEFEQLYSRYALTK